MLDLTIKQGQNVKQLNKHILTYILLLLTLVVIGIMAWKITNVKDGVIEQACESLIEDLTGLDIDLSPEDKEASRQQLYWS